MSFVNEKWFILILISTLQNKLNLKIIVFYVIRKCIIRHSVWISLGNDILKALMAPRRP